MRQLDDSEKQRVGALLADLVGINSAADNKGCERTEEKIANYLTHYLQQLGMAVEKREVYPGRPNLIAHWPEQRSDKSLMLETHMDTVSTEGMTIDPFSAEIVGDKMYGRGTCDAKGAMASILAALRLAKEADQLPADKLYFVATMSEETGCDGASALMGSDFRTEAAIVGEPTQCQLVTSHKGPLWLQIETQGEPCHAAVPSTGINAIDLMARIIRFIHGPWTERIQEREHPLLGRSTAAVTMIDGGSNINIIPSRCRIRVDCRLIPGQSFDMIIADLKDMLADLLGSREKFTVTTIKALESLDCPTDVRLVQKLLEICRECNDQDSPQGVNYFADTGPFSQAGITSVLFGPGDIAQAHTADEFIELNQLYQATEILLNLLTLNAGKSIVG